ncbi:MAG: helix-turn-helix transcriptional regulator [Bacteroidetes bacterium]|nr:helix-turn-helix transcriptional regulator [Bacteroidota bacterium]
MKRTRHIDFIIAIGLKIREIRKAKGITQELLGNLCDVEESTINRIELGKANTSLTHIKAISDALEIHPKELFDIDTSSKKKRK